MSLEKDIQNIISIMESDYTLSPDLYKDLWMSPTWVTKMRRELPDLVGQAGRGDWKGRKERLNYSSDDLQVLASIKLLRMVDVSISELRRMSREDILTEAMSSVDKIRNLINSIEKALVK